VGQLSAHVCVPHRANGLTDGGESTRNSRGGLVHRRGGKVKINSVRWVSGGWNLPESTEWVARSRLSVWPKLGHGELSSHRSLIGRQWRMGENLARVLTDWRGGLGDAWRRRERGPRAATVDSGGSAPAVARERRARPVVGRSNRGTHEGGRFQLARPLWAGYWAIYHWLKRIVTFFIYSNKFQIDLNWFDKKMALPTWKIFK
jgi:hypothetical protein